MGGDHLWDAIGAIGQAVSALALVFVLVQMRHAREEMRRSVTSNVRMARQTAFRRGTAMVPRGAQRGDSGKQRAWGPPISVYRLR